jgi:hypothetical protein
MHIFPGHYVYQEVEHIAQKDASSYVAALQALAPVFFCTNIRTMTEIRNEEFARLGHQTLNLSHHSFVLLPIDHVHANKTTQARLREGDGLHVRQGLSRRESSSAAEERIPIHFLKFVHAMEKALLVVLFLPFIPVHAHILVHVYVGIVAAVLVVVIDTLCLSCIFFCRV